MEEDEAPPASAAAPALDGAMVADDGGAAAAAAAAEAAAAAAEEADVGAALLPFQRAVVAQLLAEDGLAVLAPGLGLHQVAAALLRLQAARRADPAQRGAVLVLGATPAQRGAVRAELARARPPPPGDPPVDVTAEVPSAERARLYRSRAALFVTTRILTVDLLSGRLAGADVAGALVLNAHRATDASGEGFAVRLLRGARPGAFVRALSDAPATLAADFARPEKVLTALRIRRLHLWPRFQAAVAADLEARPPELVELALEADAGAAAAYAALAELVDACVKELRRAEPRLDTSDLTASRGLFASFDEAVRRQLAPVWHLVGPKTRQVAADLRTLRALAAHLLRFDAVTFLAYLEALRAAEGARCAWIFHSAAHALFEAAKGRVYRLARRAAPPAAAAARKRKAAAGAAPAAAPKPAAGAVPVVEPVLEELPKWAALREVLDEVAAERAALAAAAAADAAAGRDGDAAARAEAAAAPVVVFCADELVAAQLREVLSEGGARAYMGRLYAEYLLRRVDLGGRRGGGAAGGAGTGNPGSPPPPAAAPRMMGALGAGEEAALVREARAVAGPAAAPAAAALADAAPAPASDPPGVRLVALDARPDEALWEAAPAFAVVYDPDPALVRLLEVFKAQRPGRPLRVYLLRYEASPEGDRFQAAVARERAAFESLIRAKEIMALPEPGPEPAPGAGGAPALLLPPGGTGPEHNDATRRAGGRALLLGAPPAPRRVVVDVREFASPLPGVLHAGGLEICPVTLEVGDYVLSPRVCVERKAIPDLRSSLASGRLYTQAEAMCRHYATPVLLIEFEGDAAFALQAPGELGDAVSASALTSRLCLLCLHFPRLRFVWSRSLHATAEVFRQLKAREEEPDAVAAAAVGLPDGAAGGADAEAVVNQPALDVLRRLPGVTEANWRAVAAAAGSLAGLADLPRPALAAALGGDAAARRLHDFLAQDCRALFRAL
jgi:DNA excision repair protein ERCC-4